MAQTALHICADNRILGSLGSQAERVANRYRPIKPDLGNASGGKATMPRNLALPDQGKVFHFQEEICTTC